MCLLQNLQIKFMHMFCDVESDKVCFIHSYNPYKLHYTLEDSMCSYRDLYYWLHIKHHSKRSVKLLYKNKWNTTVNLTKIDTALVQFLFWSAQIVYIYALISV